MDEMADNVKGAPALLAFVAVRPRLRQVAQQRVESVRGANGERGRNRTFNLLIKSQLLCQLSYAPHDGTFTQSTG
jgi:hypothetical protein